MLTASLPVPFFEPACALRMRGNSDLSKPCCMIAIQYTTYSLSSLEKSPAPTFLVKFNAHLPILKANTWQKIHTFPIWCPATSLSITSTRLRLIAPVSTAVSSIFNTQMSDIQKKFTDLAQNFITSLYFLLIATMFDIWRVQASKSVSISCKMRWE